MSFKYAWARTPTVLRLFSATLIILFASASNAYVEFGWDGTDGWDGAAGRSGNSGPSVDIFANGQPQSFALSGQDGMPGQSGSRGDDAWGCTQRRSNYDERGADGGDGGDGGSGGDGGNGGQAHIYFGDIGHLKNIRIDAVPGRGSVGGQGAWGGRGCYCTWRFWSETQCRDVKQPDGSVRRECWTNHYRCEDGRDGRMGLRGRDGRSGELGFVTLYPRTTPVERDATQATLDVSLLDGAQIVLQKNIFSQQPGALGLLAPGSQVQDRYRLWTKLDLQSASVAWRATRKASDFKGKSAQFTYTKSGVQLALPSDILASVRAQSSGNQTSLTIDAVTTRAEAEGVSFSFEGTGTDVQVRVLDQASEPQVLKDTYNLKLYRDRLGSDELVWEGTLTSEFLSHDGKNTVLLIGRLPVKDPKKVFKPGKDIKVEFDLTRSIGTHVVSVKTKKMEYELPKK